jgi:hypothetical protein
MTEQDGWSAWVGAGRVLQRVWLTADRQGIRAQPMTAAIEFSDLRDALRAASGTTGLPQAFLRLGFTPRVPPRAPRRPLATFMDTASR